MRVGQWNPIVHHTQHGVTIANQKERQIQGDEKIGNKVKRELPHIEGLSGNELRALGQQCADTGLQFVEIGKAKTVEYRTYPVWQGVKNPAQIAGGVQFVRLHALVHSSGLGGNRDRDQYKWKYDDDQYGQHREQCRLIALKFHARKQSAVQRCSHQCNDEAPQDCAIKRQKNPA